MKLSDLSSSELSDRLRSGSLYLRTGPFVTAIQSPLPILADFLRLMYTDFLVEPSDSFADFHVRLRPPRGPRRWFRPQVIFSCDGYSPFHPVPRHLAVPLFEWGWNWCIYAHAHQYLLIHAAVVAWEDRALMLPAFTGTGKSTLCAALVNRGWRLLCDDLALVRPRDGQLVPLARPVSLKNESIEVIQRFEPSAKYGPNWSDTIKGTITHMRPPLESITKVEVTASLEWVVFLTYRKGAPAKLEPFSKAQGFLRIAENSFNYSMLGVQGFETLTGILDSIQCYEFTYGDLDEATAVFEKLAKST